MRPIDLSVTGLRGIPGVMGGVESHCEELLPRVAALAPDLRIEAVGRRAFLPTSPYDYRGVRVVGVPAPSGASTEAIVSTFLAVLRAARRSRAVHIHAIGPALMAPLARGLGLRVVMTHHGDDYDRAKWGGFAKAMLRLGERLGVGCAHQVIAVAPTLAERLKRQFPKRADRIRYIPNGAPELPPDRSSAEVLADFGLDPKGYILAIGRLVPEKGFDQLIRAFRESRDPRKLVIVGSDIHGSPFSRELLRQADDQVRFLGAQPRSVLRRLYEQADLFVLPSLHEGLPISALEAAACGTPMLLSDIVPNRDLGLDERNYFPAGNERALALALSRRSSEYAYDVDRMRESFDWNRIAERTLEVYRDALGGG
ncbi:glycosyltransferase family 4 protein [Sphingomonas sp.]|uniref:glycosyltransferase family 4 protein n=1 Tax=Sphingomonas sp. TaxID=28214 RepID=UPI0026015AEC|nr:glycosyltransferase family 4 protein [Sphingomonas sp.]MBV9528635.1 glycosyltransferase family 4 protein [Sphingomonas sp.]